MSGTMKAIHIKKAGGPEMLVPIEIPIPTAGPYEILIKLDAVGVNRPDILQRVGLYAPPPEASPLPGLEGAGQVVSIGSLVTNWKVGDMVTALLPGGGYAEYATCNQDHALRIPDNLNMEEAAALPETYFTVWSNVFMRGNLKAGERFLVHGGSSGIGTTAIQLANHFGARVFTTVGNEKKQAFCVELGAELAINYHTDNFKTVLRDYLDGEGLNLILDMVGGDYIEKNIDCLGLNGRLVMIAFLNGPKATVNFAKVMSKRLIVTGSTLRPQSDQQKATIATELETRVWPLLDQGTIRPIVDRVFSLQEAAYAHRYMESSEHMGKIILKIHY